MTDTTFPAGASKKIVFSWQDHEGSYGQTGPDSRIQLTIETFIVVSVAYGEGTRLYLVLAGFKPFAYERAVMHPLIIQDQNDLPPAIHDRAGKKVP